MTKHIQTRESVRKANSCYAGEKIDALVPPEGNTPRQVAELPISDTDRLWGLVYSCGADRRELAEFSCKCARRVRQGAAGTNAIETAEAWLRGEATADDCRVAAHAAERAERAASADYAAAYDAYAAYAASAAAYAAASAASAASAAAYDAYAANTAAYAAYAAAARAARAASAAAYDAYAANTAAERKWQINMLVEILERDDLQAS